MSSSSTPPPQPTEARGDSTYDDRSLASAVGLLDRGREGVQSVAVLTDEELMALDGVETAQLTAMPFLDEHAPDLESRVLLARTAMRSLMTRKEVATEIEVAEFEERPLADEKLLDVTVDPTILGALVLRRTSRDLVWFEREVSTQTHRLYYYPHDSDIVLEEEVTADGVHMFSIMPLPTVAARVRHLIDQPGVGGQDGPVSTLAVTALEDDADLGPRLGDTRALTIGTMVSRVDDTAKRVTFHMTGSEVIAGQPSSDGEEISLMAVSPTSVEEIVRDLFDDGSEDDAEGDAADGTR
ncbi:hypothetical protein [Brachybacterium sp. FME24]|uniref:hypothetical protein n=1 Tax=Brachybacterium sp. FME24 TaxID=2742605 RepID=UPI001868219A|nr:hypothetical protein [Brachybacterium sp. FME24]